MGKAVCWTEGEIYWFVWNGVSVHIDWVHFVDDVDREEDEEPVLTVTMDSAFVDLYTEVMELYGAVGSVMKLTFG